MIQPRYSLNKKLKIGINGFGRIGRCILRALSETAAFREGQIEVTQINDLTDAQTLAHLLKYDSVHGVLPSQVSAQENSLQIDGKSIQISSEPDPAKLAWKSSGVDLVLECTGRLKKKSEAEAHLQAGAKKVVISAPMGDADLTLVLGINDQNLDLSQHHVISNGSCTTNCLSPVAKVLHETFGIVHGSMTTVHSYTNDQKILDLPHKDLRRARAAAVSMIPTSTGAAKALSLVLPDLKGKVDGLSVRVPTPNVSLVDFNVVVEKSTTIEEVNAAFQKAAEGELKGILSYETEELVSQDYRGRPESSLLDAPSTNVIDGKFVKVLSWYDNEWGFSCRMVDLSFLIGNQL